MLHIDYIKRLVQERGSYTPISEGESHLHLASASQNNNEHEDPKTVDELAIETPQYDVNVGVDGPLTLKETIRLSLEFSMLWVSFSIQLNDGAIVILCLVFGTLCPQPCYK